MKLDVDKFGVYHIGRKRTEQYMKNGKVGHFVVYGVIYHRDDSFDDSFEIKIPHYFEEIGTERKMMKEIEKNHLRRRNLKIQRIKEKVL